MLSSSAAGTAGSRWPPRMMTACRGVTPVRAKLCLTGVFIPYAFIYLPQGWAACAGGHAW